MVLVTITTVSWPHFCNHNGDPTSLRKHWPLLGTTLDKPRDRHDQNTPFATLQRDCTRAMVIWTVASRDIINNNKPQHWLSDSAQCKTYTVLCKLPCDSRKLVHLRKMDTVITFDTWLDHWNDTESFWCLPANSSAFRIRLPCKNISFTFWVNFNVLFTYFISDSIMGNTRMIAVKLVQKSSMISVAQVWKSFYLLY